MMDPLKPFHFLVDTPPGQGIGFRKCPYATFDKAEAAAWRRSASDGEAYQIHGPGEGPSRYDWVATCGVDARGRRYTDIHSAANFTLALSISGVSP